MLPTQSSSLGWYMLCPCNIVSLQILRRFRTPKGVRLNKLQINTPPSLTPLAPTVYFLKIFYFFATYFYL